MLAYKDVCSRCADAFLSKATAKEISPFTNSRQRWRPHVNNEPASVVYYVTGISLLTCERRRNVTTYRDKRECKWPTANGFSVLIWSIPTIFKWIIRIFWRIRTIFSSSTRRMYNLSNVTSHFKRFSTSRAAVIQSRDWETKREHIWLTMPGRVTGKVRYSLLAG